MNNPVLIDNYIVEQRDFERFERVEDGLIVYSVMADGTPKRCAFNCPCGCGIGVELPLQGTDIKPPYSWQLFEKDGIPTINPSVRENKGCKSHYFLRNGIVEMLDY
jgi:hypothetical protein